MNYRAHILSIAHRAEISVRETAGNDMECKAWKRARIVQIMPVRDYRAYVLALHELAHVLFRVPVLTLDKEIVAWKGARRIARVWTEEANTIMRECLGTYLAHYRGDKRIKLSRSARKFLEELA
jgi:hypothetical protein